MMNLLQSTDIWVLISFIIFAVIAYRMGKKHILRLLDTRIEDIRSEIDTAESLRIEAQELLAQYQRKKREAAKEAEQIIDRARKHAEDIRQMTEKDLSEMAARREAQLAERLKRMEESAMNEIRAYASELAVKATTEIIAAHMDEKAQTRLIDESIQNLSGRLN